jgi:pyrroline-5-carboxylate reductase
MVEGAAALAAASDESPAQLAERVASPGGTTRAGLNVLDGDEALRTLVLQTLDASRKRGLELAEGSPERLTAAAMLTFPARPA